MIIRNKNKKIKKTKPKKNTQFKRTIRIMKNIFILILATFYYSVKTINNLGIKLFKLLPKTLQAMVIYLLIGLSIFGGFNLINPMQANANETIKETIVIEQEINNKEEQINNEQINNEQIDNEEIIIEQQDEEITIEEEIEENNNIEFNNDNEQNIYETALEMDFTQEEAIIAMSISKHETGYWTSSAFRGSFNFGGIMSNGGKSIKKYNSYEEGLEDFLQLLQKYYFSQGRLTIGSIGAKYAPQNADNDPRKFKSLLD